MIQFLLNIVNMQNMTFGHEIGQKEAFKLDNYVTQTKSRKEGFHEQV